MLSTDTFLPSSPNSLCDDRFSLTDSSEPLVHRWDVIIAVLASPPDSFAELLERMETISVTFRNVSTDYGFLREFFRKYVDQQRFITAVWPKLSQLALEMPSLFPSGCLPALTGASPRQTYSRQQIACLVVHQFLCTLAAPPWILSNGSLDFHIWYTSEQRHERAVHAYLSALFHYFERIASEPSSILSPCGNLWPVVFKLESSIGSGRSRTEVQTPFTAISICDPSAAPDMLLGIPDGASVVFANRHVGFGSTGTQEETVVGSSPEACVSVLICPPLTDDEVLVVEGAEAIVTIQGFGRAAHLGEILSPDYTFENYSASKWRRRTMLFTDALELDNFDRNDGQIPDFLPGHIDRELNKALTAFSSRDDAPYREVVTGLWGCGAFGGNAEVKTMLQWCAASLAAIPLRLICEPERDEFLRRLRTFVENALRNAWSVEDVVGALRMLKPEDSDAVHAFDHVYQALGNQS
jgi:poly(ADP-ribose) glycohydrolase